MVLDRIIEMELDFLKKRRIPTTVFMNYNTYDTLIKELEVDRMFHIIHNMQIEIVKSKSAQLLVL